jgi:hypothetical protein
MNVQDTRESRKVRSVIKSLFKERFVHFYLMKKNLKDQQNYDEKGYKVTQSELLSGGISLSKLETFG